jgi:hypothetical protein
MTSIEHALEMGRVLTCGTAIKGYFVAVATLVSPSEMKWHVHVPQEMYQEFERIRNVGLHVLITYTCSAELLVLLQNICSVSDAVKNIDMCPAFPSS